MSKAKIYNQVKERDAWCWHCGTEANLVLHHRQNRGMGGRGNKLDRADNLIRVCSEYNFMMEANADVASQARELGHKLGSWDGYDTPVFDKALVKWFTLTQDGRKVESHPPMYLI